MPAMRSSAANVNRVGHDALIVQWLKTAARHFGILRASAAPVYDFHASVLTIYQVVVLVFFFPYLAALFGAAYNVNQVLEGIVRKPPPDYSSIPSDLGPLVSVFEPTFNTYAVLAVLVLYCAALLLPALLLASYVIGRWKGCVSTLVILALPGLLAVLGLLPPINFVPREFVLTAGGVLGSALGMSPIVLMGLITGWCTVLVISDALQLGNNFRHLYDHVWYGMAVITGIFFVADLGAAHTARDLQRENERSRQASAYLLRQVRDYDLQCQSMKVPGKASCVWASRIQQTLSDYATQDEQLFHSVGPTATSAIYDPFRYELDQATVLAIRRELQEFNTNRCPIKRTGPSTSQLTISGACQTPPAAFYTTPEALDGRVDPEYSVRTLAIANEVIVPTLVASRQRQARLKQEVDQDNRYLNYKWIFYILFSVAAGGKIANSTARIVGIGNQQPSEKRRSLQALRLIWQGLKRALRAIAAPVRWCWCKLR